MKVRIDRINPLDGSIRPDGGQVIELKNGTRVSGLAPVGMPWGGCVRDGRIVPERGCPAREFLLTYAHINGEAIPVSRITDKSTP